MARIILFFILLGLSAPARAQQLYEMQIHQFQPLETYNGNSEQLITLPNSKFNVMMGGLNDWDGLANYFNIYGSKLIVDSIDRKSNGSKTVVLRREDGRKFYDRFPTISVTLTPVHQINGSSESR